MPARPEPRGEPSGQALPVLHKEVGSEGGMQILPGVCGAWDPWCLLARFTHFKTNNLLDWSASFLSFFLFCFFFSLPPKANHWTHAGRKVFYSIEILFSGNYVKNVFILWAGWEKKGLNPLRWLFL